MNMPRTPDLRIDCGHCPIRHRAVCARCEDDELTRLNAIKFYKSYEPGQVIAMRGDQADFVASVVSGVATLTNSLEDGRTQVVGLLLPSDFMGRPGRGTIAHDVTAATDITLCCFHRKPFETLLVEMPNVGKRLLEMSLDELDAARDWMLLLGRKTAREKVASFLYLVMRRSGTPDDMDTGAPVRIDLPLSREVAANYLGLTIETVSRQLTALKKEGVIELDGARTIFVPDQEALAAEADLAD